MDNVMTKHPLIPVIERVSLALARGQSTRQALIEMRSDLSFMRSVRLHLGTSAHLFERELETLIVGERSVQLMSAQRQTLYLNRLLVILELGTQGHSILQLLKAIEKEVETQSEWDIKAHLESLPQKASLPVLLCALPSYLILLVGPVLRAFLKTLCWIGFFIVLSSNRSWASEMKGSPQASFTLQHSFDERACRAELEARILPVHCWLRAGFAPANCSALAKKARRLPGDVRLWAVRLAVISKRCAVAAETRSLDLAYKSQSEL